MTDPDNKAPLDDVFFDQIVDGVLTPTQLRDAVRRLDRDPDGWKRCALAFLEDQVWNQSLGAVGESADLPARDQAVPIVFPALSRKPVQGWLRSAVAAGIIAAAFSVGWFSRSVPDHRNQGPVIVESQPLEAPNSEVSRASQESQAVENRSISDSSEKAAFPPNAVPAASDSTHLVRTVARLRLGPENAPAEVPIFAGPGVTEEWITQQPPPVSEHGQVVFQRHGYQVEQHRRILTTILPDGRRLAIPVDEVQIQYIGNEPL